MLDAHVEKQPARWKEITGSTQDNEDYLSILKNAEGETFDAGAHEPLPAGCGLILRRGVRPVGYALFDVDEWGIKKVLNVEYIHILEKERDPIILAELVQLLRRTARTKSATHIHWTAGSQEMKKISQKVPTQSEDMFLIPVEKFNLDLFVGRI